MRLYVSSVVGYLSILGGLLLLAYTGVSTVVPDTSRPELADLQKGQVVSEGTAVVGSALLVTLGLIVLLAHASPARPLPKLAALGVVGAAFPLFFTIQTLLVINGIRADIGQDSYVYFSASYLFHSGTELSFPAVYVLFFVTFLLVVLLLGAVGYLLAPQRLGRAVLDRANWAKNEAIHIAATLFLLLSISVVFYTLLTLAVNTSPGDVPRHSLMGHLLLPTYYLLVLLLFALALTVAAHAFLLNWGTQAPLEFERLVANIRTIARVERALVVASALLNLLVLFSPTLPSKTELSRSFAFDVSPRGFGYAFYVLLAPYFPYVLTTRRLDWLLRSGRGPATNHPFAERSLRLVLTHVAGLILVTAAGAALNWYPLALMLAMSAWTAGVLLAHAVRFENATGLPRLAFRGETGPAFYFVFLALAVTTGLMLWGAGNTYNVSATFLPNVQSLDVANASDLGQDLFARLAATALVAGSVVLTLDLWLNAYRVERRFLGHYLATFIATSLSTLLVFTVSVWTDGATGLENAYVGFAFQQYYALEKTGAGLLLAGTVTYLFFAVGRILRPILERSRAPARRSVAVRWK